LQERSADTIRQKGIAPIDVRGYEIYGKKERPEQRMLKYPTGGDER